MPLYRISEKGNDMQFNKYTAYSLISSDENKNKLEIQKILNLINVLEGIRTISAAKRYIAETYGIKDAIQSFPLCANGFLSVNENKQKYSIRISYPNNDEQECVIYSYNK